MKNILSTKKILGFSIMLLAFIAYKSADAQLTNSQKQEIVEVKATLKKIPVLIGKSDNDILSIRVITSGELQPIDITKIAITFEDGKYLNGIAETRVFFAGKSSTSHRRELFSKLDKLGTTSSFYGKRKLYAGSNSFQVSFVPNPEANLSGTLSIKEIMVYFSNKTMKKIAFSNENSIIRFGKVLRAAGEDNCNTYRIPGLVTTNNGTLIAVYDNRYHNSGDLQGNINIGMSRSTDRGQTWEPMKVIMNMGTWGNKPQNQNGIGDPCILTDYTTNTIWVAALWDHGNPDKAAWFSSQPGLSPTETGQFMLTKSEDNGITWSQPINITQQVKNPAWYLFFQGPGRGITLEDGTLVFPAQFKDENQVPYSTLIYSKDHGITWKAGKGAKSNTTEAQVVQLSNGDIMLNMRDDRNRQEKGESNGRAIATTSDLGQTWKMHPSSNSALPEPNCMGSIISVNISLHGKSTKVLFFSNPNNKISRSNMTIKASLDEGLTWPNAFNLEYYEDECYGYSCLTQIDNETLGILYEGEKDLFFQKIKIADILKIKQIN